MLELNRLYLMDCMEGMAQFPNKHFELAIVDPPYGIGAAGMKRGNSVFLPDKTKRWDDATPDTAYFNELFRVSQNQIVWGGNYFALPPTRCFVVWDKGETMYGRSFAECEAAWTSFNASARIFKFNPKDPRRIHPTQKPVALYLWLLKNYAKPGDKILDTHAGSASSFIAAWERGFDYLGFEIDPDYHAASSKRVAAAMQQGRLFDPANDNAAAAEQLRFDV